MIRIIGNQKQRALEWAKPYWPGISLNTDEWGRFSALILEKDGDIQAAVLYKNYIPANSIESHIAAVAGGRWLTRSFLRAMFSYPFEQLGLRRVTLLIAADNLQSRRFAEHLGFVLEGVARQGWNAQTDLRIYGMLKAECRFLGDQGGQKYRRDAGRPGSDSERPDIIQQTNRDSERGTQSRQYEHALWQPDIQRNRYKSGWNTHL